MNFSSSEGAGLDDFSHPRQRAQVRRTLFVFPLSWWAQLFWGTIVPLLAAVRKGMVVFDSGGEKVGLGQGLGQRPREVVGRCERAREHHPCGARAPLHVRVRCDARGRQMQPDIESKLCVLRGDHRSQVACAAAEHTLTALSFSRDEH